MENETLFNNTQSFISQETWIAYIVFTSILAVISTYLLITLLYHQIRIEKKTTERFSYLSVEKRYSLISYYLCIFVAIFSITFQLVSVAELTVDGKAYLNSGSMRQFIASEILCNALFHTAGFVFVFGNFMVNLFLWFRQRIFYVQPCLKILFSKCLRVFSFAVLIIYLLIVTTLSVIYLVDVRLEVNEAGVCQFKLDSSGDTSKGKNIFVGWSVSSILMQIMLLGLFIYPLLKRALWQRKLSNERKFYLIKKVKKAVILTSLCLITDIVADVLLILADEENANNATFMYSVNIVVNLLVMIACFDYWKKLLWPWNRLCVVACFK